MSCNFVNSRLNRSRPPGFGLFTIVWLRPSRRFTQEQGQGFLPMPLSFGRGLKISAGMLNWGASACAIDFPAPRLGQRTIVLGDHGKIDVFEHHAYYPRSRLRTAQRANRHDSYRGSVAIDRELSERAASAANRRADNCCLRGQRSIPARSQTGKIWNRLH